MIPLLADLSSATIAALTAVSASSSPSKIIRSAFRTFVFSSVTTGFRRARLRPLTRIARKADLVLAKQKPPGVACTTSCYSVASAPRPGAPLSKAHRKTIYQMVSRLQSRGLWSTPDNPPRQATGGIAIGEGESAKQATEGRHCSCLQPAWSHRQPLKGRNPRPGKAPGTASMCAYTA